LGKRRKKGDWGIVLKVHWMGRQAQRGGEAAKTPILRYATKAFRKKMGVPRKGDGQTH